jgi:hypothetical protein
MESTPEEFQDKQYKAPAWFATSHFFFAKAA